jgi:hypothetical protein
MAPTGFWRTIYLLYRGGTSSIQGHRRLLSFSSSYIPECDQLTRDTGKVPVFCALFEFVSQNRYSAALDPFLDFAVHLGVYGIWSSCLEYPIGRLVPFS